jgi:hypothetical protein
MRIVGGIQSPEGTVGKYPDAAQLSVVRAVDMARAKA